MTPLDIGQKLRERRKLLHLTIEQVAELSSCSMPSVHAAETGKPTLRLNILLAIARTLGLELSLSDRQPVPPRAAAEERFDANDQVGQPKHGASEDA